MAEQCVPPVRTPRLDLVSMSPRFYGLCLSGASDVAAALLGAAIPDNWLEERALMKFWLTALWADPSIQLWLARAIVRRADRMMIGHIGCHGRPGMEHLRPYAPGGVELGYTVFPAYRRHGYATEALGAMIAWAAREHAIPGFVLSINPDNVPSQALAHHFGFAKVGSYIDPEDGLEDVFALRAARPR
ncbi:MAG: GNAT family N-acetyltransferase [Chloroflexales bacterium]|nr:GNAT family N-acetyltransferase [Chloroflexales bacterium]